MNALKRGIKYHLFSTIIAFAKAYAVAFLVTAAITFVFGIAIVDDGETLTRLSVPLTDQLIVSASTAVIIVSYVMPIVVCFSTYYTDYPLFVRLGLTRKNYVISNFILFIVLGIIATVMTLISIDAIVNFAQNTSFFLENTWLNFSAYEISGNILASYLFMVSIWSVIAFLQYKFGGKIWIGVVILFVLYTNYFDYHSNMPIFDTYSLASSIALFLITQAALGLAVLKTDPDKT